MSTNEPARLRVLLARLRALKLAAVQLTPRTSDDTVRRMPERLDQAIAGYSEALSSDSVGDALPPTTTRTLLPWPLDPREIDDEDLPDPRNVTGLLFERYEVAEAVAALALLEPLRTAAALEETLRRWLPGGSLASDFPVWRDSLERLANDAAERDVWDEAWVHSYASAMAASTIAADLWDRPDCKEIVLALQAGPACSRGVVPLRADPHRREAGDVAAYLRDVRFAMHDVCGAALRGTPFFPGFAPKYTALEAARRLLPARLDALSLHEEMEQHWASLPAHDALVARLEVLGLELG